jgi:hypothetical protein
MQKQSFTHSLLSRILLVLVVAISLFSKPGLIARAGDGPHNGSRDPNYVPTAEDLQRIAAKNVAATQYMKDRKNNISPLTLGSHILSVGTWLEPNDDAHVNYCGPGATQVALDARLPASSVPDINTIGAEENIDPSWGVYIDSIRTVLNTRLNTDFYWVQSAQSKAQFQTFTVTDIDGGYVLVTGVKTGGMPGWGTRNVEHIVAVYGYNEISNTNTTIYYIETAAVAAGFTGTYRNSKSLSTFWNYVLANNVQVW